MDTAAIIQTLIGVLSGGVAATIVTGIMQRRQTHANAKKAEAEAKKIDAEANEQLRETVMAMLNPYRERADAADAETKVLREIQKELSCKVDVLEAEVRRLKTENALLVGKVAVMAGEVDRLTADNGDLESWSRELVSQVVALGGQPVPLKKKKGKE